MIISACRRKQLANRGRWHQFFFFFFGRLFCMFSCAVQTVFQHHHHSHHDVILFADTPTAQRHLPNAPAMIYLRITTICGSCISVIRRHFPARSMVRDAGSCCTDAFDTAQEEADNRAPVSRPMLPPAGRPGISAPNAPRTLTGYNYHAANIQQRAITSPMRLGHTCTMQRCRRVSHWNTQSEPTV